MFRRILLPCCALLIAVSGCMAQKAASGAAAIGTTPNPKLARKIEIIIRSRLSVPPEYEINIGPRQKSAVAGYDEIPVTFALPQEAKRAQTVNFLLSTDGSTLARLSKWNIGPGPESLLPTEGRPVRGNPHAKVTIVNFDDLECPFCARMHAEFFPDTMEHYKGLVNFIYVDFPLTSIHPWAMHAAVDADCLAAQSGKAYWNFVDYVHTHGEEISGPGNDPAKAAERLDKLTEQEGARDSLDAVKLHACVVKQDNSKILAEMKAGNKLGVDATPTFFVNGERWSGALPERQLWIMIDRALRAQGITPPPDSTQPTQPAAGSNGAAN